MNNRLAFFLLLFLAFYNFSYAAVYMSQENGTTTYSDAPLSNSQEIDIPNVSSTVSTKPISSSTSTPTTPEGLENLPPIQPDKPGKLPYTELTIVSPKDQETFQNQPSIPIRLKVTPQLQANDKIQLLVDGNLWGEARSSTNFSLTEISRGVHSVSAVLLGEDQKVILTSNQISIFVQRSNLNSPARQQQ